MFRLELLGGAVLRGPEGALTGPVVQRRRLALLALLAVARERGVSRDKAIGYLWPEKPAPRARHLLSESIHVIRKRLGEDSISGTGDDLRLNLKVVTCDITDFQDALARDDPEQAVSLYEGPFLDGFFVRRALDFERWVERQREALQRQALEAVWQMVDRTEETGAAQEAVRWARRAVALSDRDEVSVRRLIELLARTGNRHEALRVHEDLVRDLREEYGVEPSPETQRVVQAIRASAVHPE